MLKAGEAAAEAGAKAITIGSDAFTKTTDNYNRIASNANAFSTRPPLSSLQKGGLKKTTKTRKMIRNRIQTSINKFKNTSKYAHKRRKSKKQI